jgi:hypothetical protein
MSKVTNILKEIFRNTKNLNEKYEVVQQRAVKEFAQAEEDLTEAVAKEVNRRLKREIRRYRPGKTTPDEVSEYIWFDITGWKVCKRYLKYVSKSWADRQKILNETFKKHMLDKNFRVSVIIPTSIHGVPWIEVKYFITDKKMLIS